MQLGALGRRPSPRGPQKKRNVSPGLMARMNAFTQDGQPSNHSNSGGTPRRAISPRIRDHVDNFSRSIPGAGKIVKAGSRAGHGGDHQHQQHHQPAGKVVVDFRKALGISSSSASASSFPPPLQQPAHPPVTATEREPVQSLVDKQREWLNNQLAALSDRGDSDDTGARKALCTQALSRGSAPPVTPPSPASSPPPS
jgi:hypothetical protein